MSCYLAFHNSPSTVTIVLAPHRQYFSMSSSKCGMQVDGPSPAKVSDKNIRLSIKNMSDEKIIDTQANIDFVHGMDRICLTKCVTKTATIFHTRSHHTQPFNSTQRQFFFRFQLWLWYRSSFAGPPFTSSGWGSSISATTPTSGKSTRTSSSSQQSGDWLKINLGCHKFIWNEF